MQFAGVLPADAPDPRWETEERLRAIDFPIMQLAPQPSLERLPVAGFMTSTNSARGVTESSVSFSYTLWRHPEDKTDPRNLLELDDRTRRSLEEEPPWPRPQWLIDSVQVRRYPMVWEAVRTTWHADPEAPHATLRQQLVHHVNHVLLNRFREQLGIPSGPPSSRRDDGWRATESTIVPSLLTVDGLPHDAVHIDTDPFVYGIGAQLSPHLACTVVIPRDDLAYVHIAIARFDPS